MELNENNSVIKILQGRDDGTGDSLRNLTWNGKYRN